MGRGIAAADASTGEIIVTREDAWKLAEHWIAAWNAHDLEQILTHYEEAIELTSPVAAQLLGTSDGKWLELRICELTFSEG